MEYAIAYLILIALILRGNYVLGEMNKALDAALDGKVGAGHDAKKLRKALEEKDEVPPVQE